MNELQGELGAADNRKMNDYLESLRDVDMSAHGGPAGRKERSR